MLSFQAQTLGVVSKQVEVLYVPQTGTAAWQSALPVQVTPPHGSVPTTEGGWVLAHWVRGSEPSARKAIASAWRPRGLNGLGLMFSSSFVYRS